MISQLSIVSLIMDEFVQILVFYDGVDVNFSVQIKKALNIYSNFPMLISTKDDTL